MITRAIVLLSAIAVEVAATLALKAALTVPAWYILVVAGYAAAFVLLTACLRLGMPVGVTYGLWGAGGVTATAVLSAALFGEAFTMVMAIGVALIIAGVITVEVGSQRAASRQAEPEG